MKPTYRFYTADRAAKFTYPNRMLVLRKYDQFQLADFESLPVVIKDGVRWPIAKSMVKELLARSAVVKAAPHFISSVKTFDTLGDKFLKYLQSQAKKLTKAEVHSGFKNNTVWVKWAHPLKKASVTLAIVIRPDSLQAVMYSPLDVKLSAVDAYTLLTQLAKRVAKHMQDDGITVRGFHAMTVHAKNIGTPWQEQFSGTLYSFATKITL